MALNKKDITDKNLDSYLSSLGFQFPITEDDLDRFEKINSGFSHELDGSEISIQKIFNEVENEELIKEKKSKNQNLYFMRVVLAGEIAKQLHEEPTFGHVKFQKLMYLCEKKLHLDTSEKYSKQAAGPYDNKFMHTIDREFKRLKWFSVEREGKYKKYVYRLEVSIDKQEKYYRNYFQYNSDSIQSIIDMFRSSLTSEVELVATIFGCLEEIIAKKERYSSEKLIELIYNWSEEKSRFSESEIISKYNWMKENNLTPELIFE